MEEMGAHELVSRCAVAGDEASWGEFRARFEDRLMAGLRKGLRKTGMRYPPVDVEDLLQDVYCKLLDRRGRYLRRCRGGADEAVSAYLGRVAESVAIDRVRAEIALKRGRGRVVGFPEEGWKTRLDTADPAVSAEQRLLSRERRTQFLRSCCKVVGRRSRKRDLRVLYLACIEGWSSREIARALGDGLTPSSIDSLVHRARKRLAARGVGLPARKSSVEAWAGSL